MIAIAESAAAYHLTRRETDVARLVLGGLPNKSIARVLYVEVCTVKGHVSSILRKTDTHNRTQAAFRLAGF